MLITIDPGEARPIYLQIMDEIRRALVIGTLQGDEPLPSVRQLAAELRINPNTVQQAYRELEREGVVYVLRGRGTFATAQEEKNEDHRQGLLSAVAGRALLDAHRHGLNAEELIEAIRREAQDFNPGDNR